MAKPLATLNKRIKATSRRISALGKRILALGKRTKTVASRALSSTRSALARLSEITRERIANWSAKRVVTLDIDSSTIRLMESAGGLVRKWASVSLEPGRVEEGIVSDRQALSTAVKQLMASSGIKATRVIASVSGLYSVSRIVSVPNPSGGSIARQVVMDEAREIMPVSEDTLYLSWQAITSEEDPQRVMVTAVPREVIDSEIQSLRATGIHPYQLELKAMALARAVNREQALVLNIEPSSFDIIVVINGVPEIMRTAAWNPENLTEEEQAEHLAQALDMTTDFYNLHNPELPVDPTACLFVTGQMSGNPVLSDNLQARTRYPIEPLAPALKCPAHLLISRYAVNIGLALKGTAPSENVEQGSPLLPDINLLPQAYRGWKPSRRQIYFASAILIGLALLIPLYQVATEAMTTTATLETRYSIVDNELQLRRAEITSRQPFQVAINEYGMITDMGGDFSEDLQAIQGEAERLGVEVQSVAHAGDSIVLTCETGSYLTFRSYLAALSECGRFSTPIPPPEGYPYITGGRIELEPETTR